MCVLSEEVSGFAGKVLLLGQLRCCVTGQTHCESNTIADGENFEKQKKWTNDGYYYYLIVTIIIISQKNLLYTDKSCMGFPVKNIDNNLL